MITFRRRQAADPARPGRPRYRHRVAAVRVIRLVAALVLTATVVLATSSQVRAGVAELFGIGGVEVRVGPSRGSAPAPESGVRQWPTLPGEQVATLTEARDLASFAVGVPSRLGSPDRVMVSDGTPPRVVSLLYSPGPGRPPGDPVAVRLDEFDGSLGPAFEKFVANLAGAVPVSVAGAPGMWITGPHQLRYVGRDGVEREASARLAANTLVWQTGGVTFRLEGGFGLDEALAVARSVP